MNQAIDSNYKQTKYNWNLEGLRGGLALTVGLAHVFGISNLLDPRYHPNWHWLNVGHITVLVFFVMSGYVIGITYNKSKKFSWQSATQYLVKRIVRLFPIYIVALLLGILASSNFNLNELLGNLFFLQNILVPAIEANSPVWSLGYEVFYYLAFLLIWRAKIPIYTLFAFAIGLSLFGAIYTAIPEWIYAYSCGFIFWLAGLYLAWKTEVKSEQNNTLPIVSYLSLFYCIANLKLGYILLGYLNLNRELVAEGVTLSDLVGFLPICVLLICLVAQRSFPYLKILQFLCFLMPLIIVTYLIFTGRFLEDRWLDSTVLLVISIVLLRFKLRLNLLSKISFLGGISYGFYLVHFPILLFVQKYFPYSGNIISFSLRFTIWLCLSILLSFLLEKTIQPKIKAWCYQRSINKYRAV